MNWKSSQDAYEKKGLEAAIQFYRTVREQNSAGYHMEERQLNILGYHFLRQGKTDEANAFFRLNVDAFPKSSSVYDNLGEAYLSKGDRANAVENYRKAIELDPKNDHAKRMIRRAKKLR